jgi:hypothetical protein
MVPCRAGRALVLFSDPIVAAPINMAELIVHIKTILLVLTVVFAIHFKPIKMRYKAATWQLLFKSSQVDQTD